MRCLITGCALLLAAPPVLAQELHATLGDPSEEVLRERATISGSRIVGFQAVQARQDGAGPQVQIWVPADWTGGDICLKAMSADGLYEASYTYAVDPAPAGGMAQIEYATKYPDVLAPLGQGAIAVSVQKGACGTIADEGLSLSRWNAGASAEMRLLVNSFRADETLVYPGEGEPISCDPILEGSRVAYDMSCLIPAEIFKTGQASLRIMTIKDGEIGDEVTMTLYYDPANGG